MTAYNSDNGASKLVAFVIAIILLGMVVFPVITDLGNSTESETHTVKNNGMKYAFADNDDTMHTILMSAVGNQLIVTSDGSSVDTGIDTLLGPLINVPTGPFNTYYVAVNLTDGDNIDDLTEKRLSNKKGEIGYILDSDNLYQTIAGHSFNHTLYNIMLVIPPVYWYSELDSEGATTGKLYLANSPSAFESMGITADKLKDYAHTYTDRSDAENPIVGHAPAIMIGVYEGYLHNGILVSQSDRMPLGNVPLTDFQAYAVAGNNNLSLGTYELWNYYMWTLYKMMGWTVMGNMDSQYMMGTGYSGSGSSPNTTGLTDSAYQKSLNNKSSVALFIENGWGSINEWLGDACVVNGSLRAGNTLGGASSYEDVANTLEEEVIIPTISGNNYYRTFNPVSDAFGMASTLTSTLSSPGEGINDRFYATSGPDRGILVGGRWSHNDFAGLSCVYSSDTWIHTSVNNGARLAYVVTDPAYSFPSDVGKDYAYIMSYNVNGTIQSVESVENDTATEYMPTGTTLNQYWDFTEASSRPPEIADSTANVILAVGPTTLLQVYDSGNVVIYTDTEMINLGKVSDGGASIAVIIENGMIIYDDADEVEGSRAVWLYRSDSGVYALASSPHVLKGDNTIYVAHYENGAHTDQGLVDIGCVGSFKSSDLGSTAVTNGENAPGVTIPTLSTLDPSKPVDTSVSYAITSSNEYVYTLSNIEQDVVFTDTDSMSMAVSQMFVPAQFSYETEHDSDTSMVISLMMIFPILMLLGAIGWYAIPLLANRN